MTERIRVEVDDAELDAAIERIDEAILKKMTLLDIQIPVPEQVDKFTGTKEIIDTVENEAELVIATIETKLTEVQAYTEFIDSYNEAVISHISNKIINAETIINVTDTFANSVIATIGTKLTEVQAYTEFIDSYNETVVNRISNSIINTQAAIEFTNNFAEMTFQQIMFKLAGAQSYTATMKRIIELDLVEINIQTAATEARIGKVQKFARGLPQVDRATRMILLNIPGLREVLRLLYIIKLEERTLRLGGMRGPITAAVTIIMYMGIILKNMQQRQERVEERQRALEKEMDRRLITVEEALRTTINAPEKYRERIAL